MFAVTNRKRQANELKNPFTEKLTEKQPGFLGSHKLLLDVLLIIREIHCSHQKPVGEQI
jgi:hypothetical protein